MSLEITCTVPLINVIKDHADKDEDVNNNDQDDDHLELDEAFSEPLNRA